ncbi:MAG: polysaccharide export outer membrane protein [Marinoscillum sp.]|jgi:polysaccharide export outer membrane protein
MVLKHLNKLTFLFVILGLVSSCKVYKQDILFNLNDDFSESNLTAPIRSAEGNYVLAVNDLIEINLFSNKGEQLIDPLQQGQQGRQGGQNQGQMFNYLVQADGTVKVPMIGLVKVDGLTINEAESVLQQGFDDFFKETFVRIQLSNRRVTVLGVNGGQVIPLPYENMTLAEVIALYGGLNLGAKAGNIKVIRGDLSDPEVFQIDLTTVTGMKSTITPVLPGDVIYIEPWRRPWMQGLRDISPVLSITSSVIAFVLVIQNLAK